MPPVFSTQPWNNVTVREKLKITQTEYWHKIETMAKALRKQIGAYTQVGSTYTGVGLEFQISNIMVWNVSSVSGSFLRLQPMDFLTGTDQSHELANVASNGLKNQFPACGYVFPSSHQQHVHYLPQSDLKAGNDALGTLALIDTNSQSDVEIHTSVRWRCAMGANIELDYVTVCTGRTTTTVPDSLVKTLEAIQRLQFDEEANEVFHEALSELHDEEAEVTSSDAQAQGFDTLEQPVVRRSERVKEISKLLRGFLLK